MRKATTICLILLHFFAFSQKPTRAVHLVQQQNISADERSSQQHIPYPILFVHGFNSEPETWNEMRQHLTSIGYSDGGNLGFCLNCDGDLTRCNMYSTTEYDICSFYGALPAKDMYFMNFNVAPDGSIGNSDNKSNQSAIAKQAAALGFAIEDIIAATGRDKVIIVAHSMGGLAAREYLANNEFWPDNAPHVAKLVTAGTPHGGTNIDGGQVFNVILHADPQSDALRDMRITYAISAENGVFLFGGVESIVDMADSHFYDFYSSDVNCNGFQGEAITGLNSQTAPEGIDYTAIIATGDEVVSQYSANIKNFVSAPSAETFYYNGSTAFYDHTSLPKQIDLLQQAMDEPDYYSLSYEIKCNNLYGGHFTVQDPTFNLDYDYDDYYFTLPVGSMVRVLANGMPVGAKLSILDADYNLVAYTATVSNGDMQTFPTWLPPGKYYVEPQAHWQNISQDATYFIQVAASGLTETNPDINMLKSSVSISPNPAYGSTAVHIDLGQDEMAQLILIDAFGRVGEHVAFQGSIDQVFDLSRYASGTYFIQLVTAHGVASYPFIKI